MSKLSNYKSRLSITRAGVRRSHWPFVVAGCLSALAACGGGGGGSSASSTATAPITATPVSSPVTSTASSTGTVNTVRPSSTYAAGSASQVMFDRVNAARAACGFGYQLQSTALDAAASDVDIYFANRAAESSDSALSFSHFEDASKSGYTGVTPADRAAYRSYGGDPAQVNEDIAATAVMPASAATDAQLALQFTNTLLTTVYHMGGLMASGTDMGVGFQRLTSADGYDTWRVEFMHGLGAGASAQVAAAVRTFPCQDTVGLSASFTPSAESPNPAPDLGSAVAGTPILVDGPSGQLLTVSSASVTPSDGGAATPVRVIDQTNDGAFVTFGAHGFAASQVFILPLAPLTAGTAYTVAVSGVSGSQPFTTSFSFTPQ